jgi:phospholipid/cholesterol/gamma-HCH transport system permease protein
MAAGVASLAASSKLQVISTGDSALELRLAGEWVVGEPIPPVDDLLTRLASGPAPLRIDFDASRLGRWDSLLLTFLVKIIDYCAEHAVEANREGLPQGVQGLLALAYAVPERQGARRESQRVGWLTRIGRQALDGSREVINLITFVGEACQGLWAFLLGRARYRRSDLVLLIEECGAKALPIVTLISLLVGLILAFVGAMQLKMFGAQIYIADLVGIGMAREMGAMMTGIIMAGRTGAAFAAQLGTMQVNSEIDAFKTLGVSPMEFLVLPRMLALIFMMPLLCLYADVVGMLGGALVSIGLFGICPMEYIQETQAALDFTDFAVGLVKASVFGVIVAIAGCMRGMQCGRSSSAVGLAATSAVVTGIVFIVVSDALMTIITTVLDI